MSSIDQLTPAERADLYSQVGDAMYAPGFNLQGHIDANTVNGTFVRPVNTPLAPDGQAPRLPDGGAPSTVTPPPVNPNPQPVYQDVPLPEPGTPAYLALLLETGRSDLEGFNYAAHLEAKGDSALAEFDRYLNAGSGAELVGLLGQVDLNQLVVKASSSQVQALVEKFSDDPAFAAFLNVQLAASPPMVRVGGTEVSTFQVAWQAPQQQVPLPEFGSAAYKALLLETGRDDLIGFNYAAHLAAKADSSLSDFDRYLNAESGTALLALLGEVNVNELMSRASSSQVRELVSKFSSDPAFAAYLDAETRPVLPSPGTPAYEELLRQTGRTDLNGFDYDAHLKALTEATRALDGVGLGTVAADAMTSAGTTGKDTLRATGNADALLSAGEGNDVLVGGAGNDVLVGGEGRDQMRGGAGDDVYHVDDAKDTVVETASGGADSVIAAVHYRLPRGVETLILADGDWSGAGNAEANMLIGSAGDNRIDGGAGSDTLTGGAGTDAFVIGKPTKTNARDVVTDFSGDQLLLSKRDFAALRKSFGEDNFVVGIAADADDFLVYRDSILYYDPDGSGQREAIALIELTGNPTLSVSQILIT